MKQGNHIWLREKLFATITPTAVPMSAPATKTNDSSQPQKIPMLGLVRLRGGRRFSLLLISGNGSDLYHAAPRNYIPHAVTPGEMVIGPLELRFAEGDGLVAVA
jgi:hypothetical protein